MFATECCSHSPRTLESQEDLQTGVSADAQSLYALGLCYKNGQGVEENQLKALHCFLLAADQGNAKAQHIIGCKYHRNLGTGVEREENLKKAVYYHTLAANQGYSESQYRLGSMYHCGNVVQKDLPKALQLLMLAEKGNISSQGKIQGILKSTLNAEGAST